MAIKRGPWGKNREHEWKSKRPLSDEAPISDKEHLRMRKGYDTGRVPHRSVLDLLDGNHPLTVRECLVEGISNFRMNCPLLAKECIEKALNISPTLPVAHYVLSLILHELGKQKKADAAFKIAEIAFTAAVSEYNSNVAEKLKITPDRAALEYNYNRIIDRYSKSTQDDDEY